MIKASALFIAVAIALIIGMLSSSLILIAYFYRLQIVDYTTTRELDANLNSAVNILLTEDLFSFNEENAIDLYDEGDDSVKIKKINWGLFEIGIVKVFKSGRKAEKAFMYGYKSDGLTNSALYLTDEGRPLSVSGKTEIKGLCYLPESGVKKAYIEGVSFSGTKLINGEIRKSEKKLPRLEKKLIDILMLYVQKQGLVVGEEEIAEQDTIIKSFFESPAVILLENNAVLTRKFWAGNIIVYSSKQLIIGNDVNLSDVLVFAPSIKIEDGFKGSAQFIVTDSLVVGKDCKFDYPSVLGLINNRNTVSHPWVSIGQDTEVKGLIFSYQDQDVNNTNQTRVAIQKDCTIHGYVFVDGLLDLRGKVYGSVTCNKFILQTPSSIYENHLLNATIDRSQLSDYFVGSAILPAKNQKSIVKWLK